MRRPYQRAFADAAPTPAPADGRGGLRGAAVVREPIHCRDVDFERITGASS